MRPRVEACVSPAVRAPTFHICVCVHMGAFMCLQQFVCFECVHVFFIVCLYLHMHEMVFLFVFVHVCVPQYAKFNDFKQLCLSLACQ